MLHHVEIYVADLDRSTGFWRPLLEPLGWTAYQSRPGGRSWRLGPTYLVFVQVRVPERDGEPAYDRRRVGLNHIALHAGTRAEVTAIADELVTAGARLLYPDRHPFAGGPGHFAAYVEDPDGIKVERMAESP